MDTRYFSPPPITVPVCISLTQAGGRHTRLFPGPPQTRAMRSGQVNLAPGDAVNPHSTEDGEELLIPLAGRGQVTFTGTDPLTLEPGSVLYIPSRTSLQVSNTGSEPLVYVYVHADSPDKGEKSG